MASAAQSASPHECESLLSTEASARRGAESMKKISFKKNYNSDLEAGEGVGQVNCQAKILLLSDELGSWMLDQRGRECKHQGYRNIRKGWLIPCPYDWKHLFE